MAFSRPNANTSKQCQYFNILCDLEFIWINQYFHKRRQATKEGAENNPDKQQEENILVFFLK